MRTFNCMVEMKNLTKVLRSLIRVGFSTCRLDVVCAGPEEHQSVSLKLGYWEHFEEYLRELEKEGLLKEVK